MSKHSIPGVPALDSWSEVRARDHVTRYRRSGAGQCVMVLDGAGGASLWPELMHVLGANFRLIVPELPAGSAQQATFLTEFLEGLGTRSITIIAASDYAVPALELALRGVDQIKRVVLIPDGESDDPSEGSITTSAGPAAVPVLIVWRGLGASEAVPTVSKFVKEVGL